MDLEIINNNSEKVSDLTNAEKKEIKKEAKEILENKEKDNNIIVKPVISKEEKISNFFNKIEFLSLTDEEKEEVAVKIKNDSAG
jgi:hypothetical protein